MATPTDILHQEPEPQEPTPRARRAPPGACPAPATRLRVLASALVAAATTVAARPAEASCVPGFDYGAFGKSSVEFGGNSSVDSYSSDSFNSTAGSYDATHSNSGGNLGTNGTATGSITVHGTASSVYGDIYYGVGGSSSTVTINGQPTVGKIGPLPSNLVLPSVTVPTLGVNLGAQTGGELFPGNTYTTVSGDVSVGAGTYVVGTLSARLTVTSSPVVIYVSSGFGATVVNAIPAAPGNPGNVVFMVGSAVSDLDVPGGSYAMYAPDTDLSFKGNDDIYGALVGKSLKITGTPNLHYDKALASLTVGSFDCSPIEVSRASPVIATINAQSALVQGTFAPATGVPSAITSVDTVASFKFPSIKGHMRARLASTITTTGTTYGSDTVVFDAGAIGNIPGVNFTGCTAGNGTCRNVFTTTTAPESTGVRFHPTAVQLNDANASAIGALIAPASVVTGIGATQWQTIVRTVLAGALGGVDRSTVAVIPASGFAGSPTRPTIAYFGATDGMLHAVCASVGGTTATVTSVCPRLGTELWAFLPRTQLPLIRTNTARVDGSPRVVDVFGDFTGNPATGAKSWRTILTFQTGFAVGGTAATYAIDVTDPARPVVLWEYATPSSPGSFDLGTGLTVAAGQAMVGGQLRNVAILETSNGGTGGTGVVATAVAQETGARLWQFGYAYPSPPRGIAADTALLPRTGIVGGAVGVDLLGQGYMSDVVFGDLYGDLWRLNAADGTSRNGPSKPLFSFSTNMHPIGAVPAIYNTGGQQYAVVTSGGYADPTATSWTTATQYLIAASLSSTGPTIDETATTCATCALALKTTLTPGDKGFSQALIVGTQLFATTDSSDVNLLAYGSTAGAGHVTAINLTGSPVVTTLVVHAGAGSLVNARTLIYNSSSTQQELLAVSAASTTGTSVDFASAPRLTRMLWLRTQ
ncbi:MAG TPA: hypothetical protein VFK02_06210 [Kofleriaceae bacterium]|nr:hypothetical protein [Kofleriaceae bacterium]